MSSTQLVVFAFIVALAFGGGYMASSGLDAQQVPKPEVDLALELKRLKKELADNQATIDQLKRRAQSQARENLDLAGQLVDMEKKLPPEEKLPTDKEIVNRVAQLKETLDAAIADKDIKTFYDTIVQLLDIGPAAHPELVNVLLELSENKRTFRDMFGGDRMLRNTYQFKFMTLAGDPKTVNFLLYALKDQDLPPKLRDDMLEGIPYFAADNPQVATVLQEIVKTETNERVLTEAMEVLGKMKIAGALPLLQERLADTNLSSSVRNGALASIGRIGGEAALPILREYAQSSNEELQRTANRFLPEEEQVATERMTRQKEMMDARYEAKAWISTPKLMDNAQIKRTMIAIATSDADPGSRMAAFGMVKHLAPEEAVPTLLKGMQGQPVAVRRAGLSILGDDIRSDESTAAIQRIAESDPDEVTRNLAKWYLDRRSPSQ